MALEQHFGYSGRSCLVTVEDIDIAFCPSDTGGRYGKQFFRKECTEQEKRDLEKLDPGEAAELMNREKAEQFREFLTQMIGQAIEENNEKLSQDISRMVNDKVLKEIDYLMRVADERDEERFRQLDETIRLYQKENKGRAEAAAAKAPFLPSIFRKRKFGRNGNKL